MPNRSLTDNDRAFLNKIGLSNRAIQLYKHLLEHGPLTAKQAANLSNELPSAEYRLFKYLEQLGLVRRGTTRPIVFTAAPKAVGLRAAYSQFRSGLENLLTMNGADEYHLEIIAGRQALYDKYAELADHARREICIYAIGIAYSGTLRRTQQTALKRGVEIRHVLQQIKPGNFHIVDKWQRLGVRLRYSSSERGFHFMLFDDRTVLISFSDPKNTDDRLSVLTNNPAAVRLFAAEFQHIWSHARKVTI